MLAVFGRKTLADVAFQPRHDGHHPFVKRVKLALEVGRSDGGKLRYAWSWSRSFGRGVCGHADPLSKGFTDAVQQDRHRNGKRNKLSSASFGKSNSSIISRVKRIEANPRRPNQPRNSFSRAGRQCRRERKIGNMRTTVQKRTAKRTVEILHGPSPAATEMRQRPELPSSKAGPHLP